MEIPQTKLDWLSQMSQQHGIPLEDLKKYYMRYLTDETYKAAFSTEAELLDYADMLITTNIQEFHSAILTEYEILVTVSSNPKESKAGQMYNNHVVLAKLPGEGQKLKWMNIVNLAETGKVERFNKLATGTIKVSVAKEAEGSIDAFSKAATEFVERPVSWLMVNGTPMTEVQKRDWLLKVMKDKTVDIANAGKMLSAKTEDGKGVLPYSLRVIRGTISMHRIIKKTDEETKKERETGIINIVDKSVSSNPDFFKQKTVPNPKKPGETMTEYGGFSAFSDPDDIRTIGKGTEAYFLGRITAARTMNVDAIYPVFIVAPKKPTEKLQKPGAVTAPTVPDASVNPISI